MVIMVGGKEWGRRREWGQAHQGALTHYNRRSGEVGGEAIGHR
jgi:hypothetical protein